MQYYNLADANRGNLTRPIQDSIVSFDLNGTDKGWNRDFIALEEHAPSRREIDLSSTGNRNGS